MINTLLHKQPMALDRNDHRFMRLRWPIADWTVAAKLNAIFIAGVEFGDAARDYPVVFVAAGQDEDGKVAVAPIAVLGLTKEHNLFIDGAGWRGQYIPAVLRAYPFAIGRIDDGQFAICFDASCPALSGTEGEAMFNAQGEPTEFMKNIQQQLENLEGEIQRTKLLCHLLRDMELLREMRFDGVLPDGSKIAVDGFLTVDDTKLNALPDDKVLELHRSGALGMVHAHYVSLGNMSKLLDWHVKQLPAKSS